MKPHLCYLCSIIEIFMEISKSFSHQEREAYWYSRWQESGCFDSAPDDREPYTVVIPPPNVTGVLHMGHMLNNTIQDVLVRRARMQGKNACWVPGTDHASIATEAKVVQLLKSQGLSKTEIGRDAFLEHAWAWKEKYGGIILEQLKKLGASCDWSRTRFTMEEDLSAAVQEVFVELHKRGLIYRGVRMVHWDPAGKTALSDEEVVHKETQGVLYYVQYPLADGSGSLTIATSRPETIPADTAVCVHPEDPRYLALHGKKVRIPFTEREVPIITDTYIAMDFGTGCLKVTPAHDPNDYAIGQKHGLEVIDSINDDGTMNAHAGKYAGLDRFEARKAIVKDLEEAGMLEKSETYHTQIGHSERTDAVIEPKLSMQWFVDMKAFLKAHPEVLSDVMEDKIQFHPPKFKNTYKYWIENIKDWCISRQLWWGQRIPAWYAPDGSYAVAQSPEEALEQLQQKQPNLQLKELSQDEDVLDTWFSSWLWPISVFDGFKSPNNPEISYYYPTNDLVTAPEIMFFWVARMIMAGYAFKGERPFRNVYYTGIVRDQQRRKMSKSLGNSPDPLDLIQQYGADGVRVGMLLSAPAGNDLLFDEALCGQGRNFSNKIWNAYRLLSHWGEGEDTEENERQVWAHQWFESKLNQAREKLDAQYAQFRISDALMTVYKLIWDDFCSWYLEWIKPAAGHSIPTATVTKARSFFETLCGIAHPFMPFITEEIWQGLTQGKQGRFLMETPIQAQGNIDEVLLQDAEKLGNFITEVRAIRQNQGISFKAPLEAWISDKDHSWKGHFGALLQHMAGISEVKLNESYDGPCFSFQVKQWSVQIPAGHLVNVEAEEEKLKKEKAYLEGFLKSVEKKLSNDRFVQNAKPEIVANERQKAADAETKLKSIEEQLVRLKG